MVSVWVFFGVEGLGLYNFLVGIMEATTFALFLFQCLPVDY